jgi:arsenate reductase
MYKVLFVCIHNSARSQMAEEYLKLYGAPWFSVESAGLDPGELNPLVVQVMAEEGLDISGKSTTRVFDLWREGRRYDYVITVCDRSAAENCPVFPGLVRRLHLPFPDPGKLEGSRAQKLAATRDIRERIKACMREFIDWVREGEKEEGLANVLIHSESGACLLGFNHPVDPN